MLVIIACWGQNSHLAAVLRLSRVVTWTQTAEYVRRSTKSCKTLWAELTAIVLPAGVQPIRLPTRAFRQVRKQPGHRPALKAKRALDRRTERWLRLQRLPGTVKSATIPALNRHATCTRQLTRDAPPIPQVAVPASPRQRRLSSRVLPTPKKTVAWSTQSAKQSTWKNDCSERLVFKCFLMFVIRLLIKVIIYISDFRQRTEDINCWVCARSLPPGCPAFSSVQSNFCFSLFFLHLNLQPTVGEELTIRMHVLTRTAASKFRIKTTGMIANFSAAVINPVNLSTLQTQT